MKKILKYEGKVYEGIFIPAPGKQNGHLMVNAILLYEKDDQGNQGNLVEFSCDNSNEVSIINQNFKGFYNLIINKNAKKIVVEKQQKPVKLNKREDIQAMSKDAEEIITAIKKYAIDGLVYLKDVKNVNPNKLYGHLINLEKVGIIKRMGKDSKRGTKIKILK